MNVDILLRALRLLAEEGERFKCGCPCCGEKQEIANKALLDYAKVLPKGVSGGVGTEWNTDKRM